MVDKAVAFASADEMFAHLARVPDTLAIEGVVAPIAPGETDFHFSHGGCSGWTRVPADIVESFQPLGKVACGDHLHDAVRLHLKQPADSTGAFLADLMKRHPSLATATMQKPVIAGITPPPPDAQCPQGYYWDAGAGTYRCRG